MIDVVTVCTHNRTRSVIAAALLAEHLDRLGVDGNVRSAGTVAGGLPPTPRAQDLLARRGHDVSGHLSTCLSVEWLSEADLLLVAEPRHVVWIGGQSPDALGRAFTLPEFVLLGERVGPRRGRDLASWLAGIDRIRPPRSAYLQGGGLPMIADPTGGRARRWSATFAEIDQWCGRAAALLE